MVFLSGPEASGRGVRRVAQLRDSPVDLLLGLAGDVAGRVDGVETVAVETPANLATSLMVTFMIVHLFTQFFCVCVIICILQYTPPAS